MNVSPARRPAAGSADPAPEPADPPPAAVPPWAEPVPAGKICQVLVVDDHATFAEVLASRLEAEPGIHASAATTVDQARWILAEHGADLLLLSVDLENEDSIQFAREVRSSGSPDVRIVAVASDDDEGRLIEAVRVGISGWVPKSEPVEYLLSVVRGALSGETWIPPRLLTRVLVELQSAQHDGLELAQLLTTLTGREKEILGCLVSGMNRDSIAQYLYLSRNTVRTHIQNMLRKLEVHSTLAAVALARRAGLGHHN